MLVDFKGDSATFKFRVKVNNVAEDITDWKILAEFGDGVLELKKATANVAGGGDDQIKITEPFEGRFEVYLLKSETTNFQKAAYIEVAALIDNEKDTLYSESLELKNVKIDWETP